MTAQQVQDSETQASLVDATERVALTSIMPNPWNPHRMTDAELEDLEHSILDGGQWRPILVVRLDQPDEETDPIPAGVAYRIVDGEHLWRALTNLHLQGLVPDEARVMVLGDTSDIPTWRQKDIGQTINHGLRGSQEDPEKTKAILTELLKHRKPEVVARRMGMGVAGVAHLTAAPTVTGPRGTGPANTLSGAVKVLNQERKNYTIALVFETSTELETFEQLVTEVGADLGLHREHYSNRAGRFRIEVLTRLLEGARDLTASPDDAEDA